jgi:uncharacterized protein YggE
MRSALRALGLLVAIVFTGCATAAGPPAADLGISSTGIGRVSVRPDAAEIDVGVEARAPQLADATAEVTRRMRDVLARIRTLGVADADIRTTAYRIEPIGEPRQPGDTGARIVGYRVLNVVDVRVREVDRVGPVVDAAVAAGANVVASVRFRLADPAKVEAEARRLAMLDAQSRAQQVAAAAGVRLGRLLAVSEAVTPHPVGRVAMAATLGGPVEAGQLEVAVSVSARYAIEP